MLVGKAMHNNSMAEVIVGPDDNVSGTLCRRSSRHERELRPGKRTQQVEGPSVEAGLSTILGNRFCSSLIILRRFSP